MGTCCGKQEPKEVEFDQEATQLTHLPKSTENQPNTEPSGSSEVLASEKNISNILNSSSPFEANQEDNKELTPPNTRILNPPDSSLTSESCGPETMIKSESAVFPEPDPPLSRNPSGQFKQKRLFHVVNGTQLRIRFGPLATINQEESQVGDTAKQSQASRRDYNSNFDFSNYPNE